MRFTREKSEIINNKVNSLKSVNWVRKVDYPTWFSNIVLANKAEEDHRMCVDFTYGNMATPKDCFPCPTLIS